mgnify:CR=1 FL=1
MRSVEQEHHAADILYCQTVEPHIIICLYILAENRNCSELHLKILVADVGCDVPGVGRKRVEAFETLQGDFYRVIPFGVIDVQLVGRFHVIYEAYL